MSETLKRAAELLRQYGRMANTVKAYQGDETLQVAADIERMAQAEPVAWVRFRSDGCYEGPIMHEQMGEVHKKYGTWTALHAAQRLPRDVLMAVAREVQRAAIQSCDEAGGDMGALHGIDLDAIVDQHAAQADAEPASAQAQQPADVEKLDAARYRWLRSKMLGVDFDWCRSGITVLAFQMPDGCAYGGDCDKNIDAAMQSIWNKPERKP